MDNFRAMEVATYGSNPEAVKKLIVSSFMEAVVVDSVLAVYRSIACFLVVAGVLLKNEDEILNLITADHRFPMDELHRRNHPGPENVDGSDTEDDDDEDDDADQDDDEGDEDFSGEEGEDDEEGDPEDDPVANGNANGNDGSDDDEDEEDDDGDEDEDGEDDEDEDDEDEDEEDAPPAKKRK